MKRPHPPIEILRRSFLCDEDGRLWWRERPREDFASDRSWRISLAINQGRRADSLRVDGYRTVSIRYDGVQHTILAHRLIWALAHGRWPTQVIDHINQDRGDNRLQNLREASRSENGQNSFPRGVSWDKFRRKFSAQIMVNRKTIHLGRFATEDEASKAYLAAKKVYHPFMPEK